MKLIHTLWFVFVVFFCSNQVFSLPTNLSWYRQGLGGLVRFTEVNDDYKVIIGIVDNGVIAGIDSANGTYLWRSTTTENDVLIQSDTTKSFVAAVTLSQPAKNGVHFNCPSCLPTANFRVLNKTTGNLVWSMQRNSQPHPQQKSLFFKNIIRLDIALQSMLELKDYHMMVTILNENLCLWNYTNGEFKLKHIFLKEELIRSLPPSQYTDIIPIRIISFKKHFLLVATLFDSPTLDFLLLELNPLSLKVKSLQKITINTTLDSEIYSIDVDTKVKAMYLYTFKKMYYINLNATFQYPRVLNESFEIYTDAKYIKQKPSKMFPYNISIVQTETGIIEMTTDNKKLILPKSGQCRLVDSLVWLSDSYHGVLSFDDLTLLGFSIHGSNVSLTWSNDEALSTVSTVQVAHSSHALSQIPVSNMLYSFYKFPSLSIKNIIGSIAKITSTLYHEQARHYAVSWRQNNKIIVVSSYRACALLGLQPSTGHVLWKRYCPQTFTEKHRVKQVEYATEPFLKKQYHVVSGIQVPNYPQILVRPGKESSNKQSKHDHVVVLWSSQKVSWISPDSGEALSPLYDLPFHVNASIQLHPVFYSAEDVVLIDKERKQAIYLPWYNTSPLQNHTLPPLYLFDVINSTVLIGTKIYPTLLGTFQDSKVETLWSFNFNSSQEIIQYIATSHSTVQASPKVKFEKNIELEKFDTTNHILVSTIEENTGQITIYLFNTFNGWLVISRRLPSDALSITKMLLHNNRAVVVYTSSTTLHQYLLSIEFYHSLPSETKKKGLFNISIFNTFPETQMKSNSNTPVVLSRTFVLVENHPEVIRFTETRYGVTPSLLLMVNKAGQLVKITQQDIAATRPYTSPSKSSYRPMENQFTELGVRPYTSLIRKTEQHLVSGESQILDPHGIFTFIDQFESVCNVFIYGLDLFFSNIRPVMAFDSYHSALDNYSLPLTIVLGVVVVLMLRRKALKYQQLSEWK